MKINIEMNRSEDHLEFSVKERSDGTFAVIEHLVGGVTLTYTGFPSRREAERFVTAQPEW